MSGVCQRNTLLLSFPAGTPAHLHIVLTDPQDDPPVVVLVNLTTCKSKRYEDHTVILSAGDHSFLKHDSYVPYDYARRARADVLEKMLKDGTATIREDIGDAVFERVKEGLLNSDRTPIDIQNYCRKSWNRR